MSPQHSPNRDQKSIDFVDYRTDALAITERELEYRNRCLAELPPVIIDVHTHAALPEHLTTIVPRAMAHMMSTFPWQSLDDSNELDTLFYPDKTVRRLRFSKTLPGIDYKAVNSWLSRAMDSSKDRFAVFGLQEDVDYTIEQLVVARPTALKMYYFVTDPPGRFISDVFPDAVVNVTQALDIPLIMHLPRNVVDSVDELLSFLDRFPDQRIVLAHLGSPLYMRPGLPETYSKLADRDRVYMDTACMEHADVISLALEILGNDRIMFGSDEPLSMLRTAPYVHPEKGARVVGRRAYHWSDSEEHREYGHLAQEAVHNQWQQLQALISAATSTGDRADTINKVFYENARGFFGF